MTAYVALLRGINVGGRNKLSMTALRTLLEQLGYEKVVSYIQSGNVVFTSSANEGKVAEDIATGIEDGFGFPVPVIVRSRAQLKRVVADNPYLEAGADPSKLHVTFLAAKPKASAIATLDPERCPPDEFTVRGREIFMLLPNGMGQTKLTIDYFERRLATTATARNWRTVNTLLDLMAH